MNGGAVVGIPSIHELTNLCAEVIGVPCLVPEANFFEVGGDSISAARLALCLEERWGLGVDIFMIFAAYSIKDMYASLAAEAGRPEGAAP